MKLLEVKYISPSSSSGANLYIRVELLNGCLIAKSVRVSEQNSVRLTFYKYIYNIVITFYHDISDFLRNFF